MGTTLGTVYVQIVPSAQGIKGSMTKVLSGEADAAGAATGSSLGSKVVSFAKKAIVAGAIGKVLKDTLIQGADLEQLKGGVEKIFDGANTSQIFADASNAYKDLNLSANDYLSTITSVGATFASTMGDQKGYDVARAGMLAVSDFATGTGKDVALLNDKFQMISRSTSSYQSIADQFAGLLPQTSSDFLAQAQAAGFLSDEYTSLTDVPVAEYQQALVKMMQQGTESMGLAGNTATETEKTFSGSFAAMKASAQNFLGSLASGENVGQSMTNLMTSVSTFFFGNFLPMIGTLVKSLPAAIGAFLQQGLPLLISNITSLLSSITSYVTGLADGLTGQTVTTWLSTNIPKILSAGGKLIGQLATSFITNLPKIVAAIGRIGLAIITGLGSAIWGKVAAAAATLRDRFMQPINQIKEKFQAVVDKIKGFFPISIGKILSNVKLPHFSISGKFSLNPPSTPKLSIDWYAKGGIMDSPTLFGMAGGEAGPEAILPLNPFWKKMDEIANNVQGGATFNFYINGSDKDPKEIAEEVKRVLIRETNQRRLAWQ